MIFKHDHGVNTRVLWQEHATWRSRTRDLALLLFSGIGRNMLFQSVRSIDALLSQSCCWPHFVWSVFLTLWWPVSIVHHIFKGIHSNLSRNIINKNVWLQQIFITCKHYLLNIFEFCYLCVNVVDNIVLRVQSVPWNNEAIRYGRPCYIVNIWNSLIDDAQAECFEKKHLLWLFINVTDFVYNIAQPWASYWFIKLHNKIKST